MFVFGRCRSNLDYGAVCQLEHSGCLNKYFITKPLLFLYIVGRLTMQHERKLKMGQYIGYAGLDGMITNHAQLLSCQYLSKRKQMQNEKSSYCLRMHCFSAARNNFKHFDSDFFSVCAFNRSSMIHSHLLFLRLHRKFVHCFCSCYNITQKRVCIL